MNLTDARYKKIRLSSGLFVAVAMVGAFGVTAAWYARASQNDKLSKSTPSSVASTQISTTAVLGATDELRVGLVAEKISIKQVGDLAFVTLTVTNKSADVKQFSPGLQLYALDSDSKELAVSALDDKQPLTGGPLGGGESATGTVVFKLSGKKINLLRVYEDATNEQSTRNDTLVQ